MAAYDTLRAAIDSYIKANGNKEITGTVLNDILNAMVSALGADTRFAGVAVPTTNPGNPEGNVVYFASQAGTYSNFGNIAVTEGITILKYDGINWSKEQISYSDGVFDISAYNGTSYADLSAALGTNGANIPQNLRKGGMSVKFVLTSDNKYVQYRLMTNQWSTTVTDWQGVDDEPTEGSNNLVKSSGVYKSLVSKTEEIEDSFVSVTLDSINRMTESLSKEGVKKFYGPVNVEDDLKTKGSSEVGTILKVGEKINIDDKVFTFVENVPNFILCLTDADNKIVWGIKKDGNVFYGAGVSPQIKEYVEEYVVSVLQKNALEEIPISFVQTGMNGAGEVTSTSNTHITTQKIYGEGYYLIIMPDELKCEYNVYNYNTRSRFNVSSVTPCSNYVNRENDFIRICFSAKDGSELIIGSLPDSIKNNIHIYRLQKSLNKNYDVTVAASDSREYDKMRADIVLNGINDTEILASLFGCGDSIKILLYGGNYIVNKFYTVGDYNKVAIPFNVFRYTGNVSDIGQERIKYTIDGYAFGSGYDSKSIPTFVVTEELHNSIDDSEYTYSIISAPNITNSPDYGGMGRATLEMNNLYVFGWYYDKAIIYVDASRFDSAALNNVNVRSYHVLNTYEPFHITPKEGLVGIRVGFGSNFGILNYVKHCNIWYCYIGVSCVGEHYIFEDVKTHHDYIGFAFGDISTQRIMEHPNMMIGCSIEACYRYMLLTKRGEMEEGEFVYDYNNGMVESTLYCIGLSTEGVWSTPYIAELESDSELPASPNINDTYKIGNTYKQWNGSTWITLTDVNPHTLGVLEIKKGMYNGLINGDDIFAADEDSCKHMEIQCYRGNTTYVRKSSNLNENWNGTF